MYVGWRIWYADGSQYSSRDGGWQDAPSQGVQFVTWYEERTYPIWIDTGWVTENYVIQFHGQDYYWPEGAGSAADVPEGVSVKTGSLMPDLDYWNLAAEAQTVRVAP